MATSFTDLERFMTSNSLMIVLWELYSTVRGGSIGIAKMAFDNAGNLLGFENRRDSVQSYALYSIDTATGAETFLSSYEDGGVDCCFGFTYSSLDDEFIFSPRIGGGQSQLETIDPTTSARTTVGPTGLGLMNGLAGSVAGAVYGSLRTTNTGLYSVDGNTGAATLVGSTGIGINSMSFGDEVAVPEPGMIGILGLGLVGLGYARRRRKV
jgi:hypothetical protein